MDGDIAVVGLGAMGSFAFWQLAKMGQNVIGIEQFAHGHEKGEAHGESRIFRTAYGEGVEYVPLLKETRKLWRELESETGTELYNESGVLMIGSEGHGFLDNVLKSVNDYNLPYKVWRGKEAKEHVPQLNFKDSDISILEHKGGFLKPELAVESAVNKGKELGGEIYTESEVTAVNSDSEGVSIWCGDKLFKVRRVIVAAGGWTPALFPQLHLPVRIERQVQLWYEPEDPDMFSPEVFPVFSRRHTKADGSFYGFPSLDGRTVKVAFNRGGIIFDSPASVDRTIHEETDIEPLKRKIKKYLPGLKTTPVKGKTCFYTVTPDGYFILGQAPGIPNVTLLGPMAGHGFKFAPLMGKLAAQTSLGLETDLPIDMFDPGRFEK